MATLCTRFDPLQAAFDRDVDRLVVAELEVKQRHMPGAAPIAAVQGILAHEIERPGDRFAILERKDQHDPVSHPLSQ